MRVLLAVLIFATLFPTLACNEDGGPSSQGETTGGTTETSTTTGADDTAGADTADDTAGDTGPGVTVCPDVPHTDLGTPQVLDLDFADVIGVDVRDGRVCPGTSHYFVIDNPCPVYVHLDLRGDPDDIDNDDEDFDLYLTEHFVGSGPFTTWTSNGKPSTALSNIALPFEALHHRLPSAGGEPHLVEVRHVNGGNLDYRLTARVFPAGSCSAFAWTCEATTRIEAEETSCTTEPTPSCTTTTTDVPLPTVSEGMSTVDGWRVYTGPNEVRQVHDPTSSELAQIEARCIQACQAQWNYDDAVSANCSVSNGFETPRLAEPSAPAVDAIDTDDQDGSGIFQGQSLGCNLTGSCCGEMDEDLCMAIPRRVTPGPDPLEFGEEYRLAIAGDSELTIATNAGSWTTALTGEVGFSLCPQGNGNQPCPFYLGSATAMASTPPHITLDCGDGTEPTVALDAATVTLDQPSFGIAQQGSDAKGFPPGSIILSAALTIDDEDYQARFVNTEPAVLVADEDSFLASDVPFEFSVPCNPGIAWVTATVDLTTPTSGAVLEGPPTVEITTPTSVNCPGTVNLTATTGDPDGDFDFLRWYVDDNLIAQGTTSIQISESHTLRAVAFDQRGAATTDVSTIDCS